MDTEIVVGTTYIVPVRLLDVTTFTAKTGITSPTVFLHKQGAGTTTILKSIVYGTNWVEIDSINFPGCYELTLDPTETDVHGTLMVSVKDTTTDFFIGLYQVVAGSIYSFANDIKVLRQASLNRTKVSVSDNTFTIYADDDASPLRVFDLKDDTGAPSVTSMFERAPRPGGVDGAIINTSGWNGATFSSPTLVAAIVAGTVLAQQHIVITSATNPANIGSYEITMVDSLINTITYNNTSAVVESGLIWNITP